MNKRKATFGEVLFRVDVSLVTRSIADGTTRASAKASRRVERSSNALRASAKLGLHQILGGVD
jgi:hypothetical protein